ncbi:MAG: hypothetical protein LLF98_02740 [Clostridium sp.]|uniref:hypothetical protein n=1 Tax=Clostridium sp. TaxID=1506 RepID=UPI0025BB4A67|nr:hypothetical protein [Clostridium sp.]MCE5220201.1 hypothetical protein [Clostridium sp.]
MIGLQEYIIKNSINVPKLAEEMKMQPNTIWRWFNLNKVPDKYIEYFSDKYKLEKDYISKIVNNINTYKPRFKGFANEYKIFDDYTEIYIVKRNGEKFTTLIDTEDLPKLIKLNLSWNVAFNKNIDGYYVAATEYIDKNNSKIHLLHKIILDADVTKNQYIDHKDHDTLNNRKYNLQIIENDKNTKNRKSKNSNNKSGYRNVFWNSGKEKWQVSLCQNYKRIIIGYYDDVDEAGRVAEESRQQYYGKFAGKS